MKFCVSYEICVSFESFVFLICFFYLLLYIVPVSKDNEKKTGFLNCQGNSCYSCSKKSPSKKDVTSEGI